MRKDMECGCDLFRYYPSIHLGNLGMLRVTPNRRAVTRPSLESCIFECFSDLPCVSVLV
jgi:hypothetical protein